MVLLCKCGLCAAVAEEAIGGRQVISWTWEAKDRRDTEEPTAEMWLYATCPECKETVSAAMDREKVQVY